MAGSAFFLSKNYINADDTINVSSGDVIKGYIYDQNKSTQWQSSGETAESGYDTYIEVIFYEGTTAADRTIDTIVLQNINLKQFKLQYFTGGAYADVADVAYTTNAATSLRVKLSASITTSKIKLLMQSTIVAGEEKKVGEFWACLETYNLATFKTQARARKDDNGGANYRLANGTLESFSIYEKANLSWKLQNITAAQMASLLALFQTRAVMTFYPDYTYDIDEIYLCQWTGIWDRTHDPKTNLYTISLDIREQ